MTISQENLDIRMVDWGIERAKREYTSAVERGSLADTKAGISAMQGVIEPLISGIAEFMVNCEAGGLEGGTPLLFQLCGAMDPAVLSYLTLRGAISKVGEGGCTLTSLAATVGRSVEVEGLVRSFRTADPDAVKVITKTLRRRGTGGNRAAVVFRANAKQRGLDVDPWTPRQVLMVGLALTDQAMAHVNLFELYQIVTSRKSVNMVRLTSAATAWLTDRTYKAGLLAPSYLPMVEPPVPWRGIRGGGYRGPLGKRAPLTKRTFKGQLEALAAAPMETVFAAVNAVQETPWAVNQGVLKIMRQAWETGRCFPGVVNQEDTALPPQLWLDKPTPEELAAWKYQARCVHESNAKARAARFKMSRLLSVAEELKDCPALYFPHQLDFRGREYAVPVGLSPQGPDEAKALLHFAVSLDLGPESPAAKDWLMIHGANCFGVDKVSFEGRIKWAKENHQRILNTAQAPFDDLWWTEADKPWCFLAYCLDTVRVEQGMPSSLPVAMDGSCNGIQHYAAILRDPIAGAAVNLTPSDIPQDIYGRVADRVTELLREKADGGDWVARGWLDFGIDRKITKRPVMVLPYGGTRMSCMQYTREAVQDKIATGSPNPFGEELAKPAAQLAMIIWDAIADVVVSSRLAMGWLQTVARAYTEKNLPLTWTVPSGFVVYQGYLIPQQEEIDTIFGKLGRVRNKFYTDTEDLNGSRQALSFPPNFIHSYDAAALALTVATAHGEGLRHFACIHDSFGTLARDSDQLARIIREQFVKMYEEHDPLGALYDQAQTLGVNIPLPPERGSLNLKEVYNSPYFFA